MFTKTFAIGTWKISTDVPADFIELNRTWGLDLRNNPQKTELKYTLLSFSCTHTGKTPKFIPESQHAAFLFFIKITHLGEKKQKKKRKEKCIQASGGQDVIPS